MLERLTVEEAHSFCEDMFQQLGVESGEAGICSRALVLTSLRGVDSHGILSMPIYAERICSGQIKPGGTVRVLRESSSTLFCDGEHGLGPVLAMEVAERVVDRAEGSGLAAASLINGNYVGALAPYVERIADRGMLGICAVNSTPRVAPQGGRQGIHGTNPLAYAVPSTGVEPLVFDAATGHSAARVVAAREQGIALEDGVLIDGAGLPSNDPEALDEGALLPVGGALGYGLGLLVDLLCGGLSNGPCGIDVPPVGDLDSPYGCSFFILAINGDFFGGQQALAERCTFLLDSLHQIAPAQGQDRVRAPGERSVRERRMRLEQGIPLHPMRWRSTLERLRKCGLIVDLWT